jgi:hypothetical protein
MSGDLWVLDRFGQVVAIPGLVALSELAAEEAAAPPAKEAAAPPAIAAEAAPKIKRVVVFQREPHNGWAPKFMEGWDYSGTDDDEREVVDVRKRKRQESQQ